MTYRNSMAAAWFVVAWFAACAHATVGTTGPSVIHAPIAYPASALSAREEGTVLVAAEVDTNGRAVGAKISRSCGFPDLDAAALRSIAGWSFAPAMKDGKPMAQQVIVPVHFELIHGAARVSPWLEASAIASLVLRTLGTMILLGGVIWSWVLAKRKSNLWLWGMVPVWILTYPVFVATHWSLAKRNLAVVLLGFGVALVGGLLALLGRAGI